MANELSEVSLENGNIMETAPRTETPTSKVVTEERSNTTDIQHDAPCPQEQSNTAKTSDEQLENHERSSSLEQSSEQPGDRAGRDGESEDPDVRSAIGSEPSSNEDSSQVEVSFDSQVDPNQSKVVEFEPLSPKVEGKFLDMIRRKLLFMWGASKEDVTTILINGNDLPTLRLSTDNDTTVNLAEVFRAQLSTCQAWPRHRFVPGVDQYLLASDGTVPATKVPWEHVQQAFQDDIAACTDEIKYVGYEDTWHRWCFESDVAGTQVAAGLPFEPPKNPVRGKIVYCKSWNYSKGFQYFPLDVFVIAFSDNDPFSVPDPERHDFRFDSSVPIQFFSANFRGGWVTLGRLRPSMRMIDWRIRYFTPDKERDATDISGCLVSDRQNATILRDTYVQEKRAQISFRVLTRRPGLFHILVLSDEEIERQDVPSHLTAENHAQTARNRDGLRPGGGEVIPFTQFLLEICRAFEKSMKGWGETLDAIDKLVHVNLSDFNNRDRIEDLMFDKSFNRSRDYFVALQLLRIINEWIEEVLPSIQEIREHRSLKRFDLYSTEVSENLNAIDRYMKERASAVQRRIQKKTEEINSLRDGLFNATSLRESTKAMALNQAIYVFTVVTVLFTPVSFLATFWALPFLNNPKEGSDIVPEPSAFRNSFIVMPLLTYALVLGIAWHVRNENPNATLSRLAKATWRELRQWSRSIWELRPRLPERKKATYSVRDIESDVTTF